MSSSRASSRAPSAASTAATKRSRVDPESAADPGISRDEIQELLSTFRADLAADIAEKTSSRMELLVTNLDENFTRRLGAQELIISDLAARAATLENDKSDIVARLDRLQAALAVADAAPHAAVADGSFDRAPDPSVMRLSAKEHFSPEAARDALRPWFREADVDDDAWEVLPSGGGGISKHHVVVLKGQPELAARRVRKILDLRRLPGGAWRPNPEVHTPTDRTIELFASPDKSTKQIRTELGTKRLHRALAEAAAGKPVHLNKRSGVVSIDWRPVAKVEARPNDDFSIQWHPPAVAAFGIDKKTVLEKFNAAGPTGAAGIEWCE